MAEYQIASTDRGADDGVTLGAVAARHEYDKEANLERYEDLIADAGKEGVRLLVFPEQSVQGYVWEDGPAWDAPQDLLEYQYEHSETVPGPAIDRLVKAARASNTVVAVGMTERHPTYGKGKGGLYNSAVLLDGDGVIGVHRKAHSCGTEKHVYRRGREIGVFDTPLGRIGMAICYDILFPETARVAAVQGADLLAFLTVWPADFAPPIPEDSPDRARWDFYHSVLRVRALENQMWIVAGAGVGRDDKSGWDNLGQAKIVGPDGVTLVETDAGREGIALARRCDIGGEVIRARTSTFWGDSFLFDRNPGAYGVLADEDALYPPVDGSPPARLRPGRSSRPRVSRHDEAAV
jgi:predicted amidohydrolase